jgi:pentose-5-phosphate-3-epimerase
MTWEAMSSKAPNLRYGSQAFLPKMLPKVHRLGAVCAERRSDPVIEVDGEENEIRACRCSSSSDGGSSGIP